MRLTVRPLTLDDTAAVHDWARRRDRLESAYDFLTMSSDADALVRHRRFAELTGLGLPGAHFAVAGSAALFARGIIGDPRDIDVIARGPAWEQVTRRAAPVPANWSTVHVVRLFGGAVEVFDGWFPEFWSVDDLIDGAEPIGGFRVITLDVIATYKRHLDRRRDREHLAAIARHVAGRGRGSAADPLLGERPRHGFEPGQ